MLWYHRLAHVGLKALEILPTITDAAKITGKCNCESCVKCKFAPKPCFLTTFGATEPLQLLHSDICGPLESAIGGGPYMLLLIDDTMRHTDQYILKFKSHPWSNAKNVMLLEKRSRASK
jgi:hypothetical protein